MENLTVTEFHVKNVYIDLDGTLRPLPFDGGTGLWRFDGQFFYKPPVIIVDKEIRFDEKIC